MSERMPAGRWLAEAGGTKGGPTRMYVRDFVRLEAGLPPKAKPAKATKAKAERSAAVKVLPTQAQLLAQSAMHAERSLIVNVTIPGEPVPKGRPRSTKTGRHYTPEKTKTAEAHVGSYLARAMGGRRAYLFGDVDVDITFWRSDRRRLDVDNLVKLVWDAANGVVWDDDAQVRELRVRRRLDPGEPRTVFAVRPSDGPGEWRRCARCGSWTKNTRFCGRVCR